MFCDFLTCVAKAVTHLDPSQVWSEGHGSGSLFRNSVASCSGPDYFISLVTLIELDSSLKVTPVRISADTWLVNAEPLFYKSALVLFSTFF